MPFYVEYIVHQNVDVRSAVDGNDLGEALPRATETVRAAGLPHGAATFRGHGQHLLRQR
jgi:hypothetical protein